MDTTIILLGVIIFAFVVSRVLRRYLRSAIAFSGAEYLALGVIIGPVALNVMTSETLDGLQPVTSLLLGILGFRLGLMLHSSLGAVRTVPPRLLTGAFVMVLCAAACFGFLYVLTDFPLREQIWVSATIGTIAGIISVTRLDEVVSWLRARGWVTDKLRSFAVLSEVLAIVSFGLVSAWMRPKGVSVEWLRDITTTEWVVISAVVGLICGVLFVAFIGKESSPPRIFLATVGVVIFASGMGSGLGVSPMFVNLLAGATVAALSSHAAELERVVKRLEHPSFVVLLILAGALWRPAPAILWAFIPIYLIVRFGALRVGAAIGLTFYEDRPPARRFGNGLVAQGAYAVAVAVNFSQLQPQHGPFVLTVVLVAVLILDLAAITLARRVLGDAEEIAAVVDTGADDDPGGGAVAVEPDHQAEEGAA